ncbi:histone H2A deubiquitinase [Chloropicon primus]|uniref:Myb-like, SWIRM and MPN domain-containing protein 1 n=1 Tax=Chloropicon primus TaxID=1764295 RepID=A0A5B8MP63_9CHLO|nr:hypothetical protein A3770_05p36380 [Chloropicon primus]UPR00334.1 histone H2A deubiquitinase [Chloropicon primus]|mmetsp:Transcript_8251/g.23596  ORF Transcript_8251/g.23596 Transcript_8251/m.23596 type:complete len:563 (-) Transcript_8251:75-1763(-)|eukprot:QDZ21120.1 hypothetical protein A3770_05p36380 [Chloropicon primus]
MDADEATNALIAQMLAEDDAYEDMYGLGPEDDSEEEFGRKRKKKGKGKGSSSGRPRKEKGPRVIDPNQEYSATGRKKRKDAGKLRTPPRAWTPEEERLFREALKLYGRNWKECASHVGTRDQRSFTSHAQKYFIKMCLQGKPLPRKVAESGEGYTLSGKPLDPNSAAARAYGFKPDTLEKLKESGQLEGGLLEVGEDGHLKCKTNQAVERGETGLDDELPAEIRQAKGEPPKGNDGKKEVKVRVAKVRPPKAEAPPPEPAEPTEYAKNRPKRENAGRNNVMANYVSNMSGSLDLCPCTDFVGIIGSNSSSAQPYHVEVSEEAMLLMDFHAHLSCYEVIGYLAGDWDAAARKLSIKRAFPCKGLTGTQQTDSCEMDPASELDAKQKMDELGLKVVGWYHSHPTFKPNPSEKDIENQENYQAFFHDEGNHEPFVGMIFSPYDVRLPTRESRREMFWVKKSAGVSTPMRMKHARKGVDGVVSEDTKGCMIDLIGKQDVFGRVDLTELWRPFTRLNGKVPEGGPVTKLAKMRGALGAYLPDTDESDEFLDEVFTSLQTQWKLDLGY